MPAQPAWLLQLPEIRAALSQLSAPVVDRAGIELVFGVGRRRAIELLHQFGGYQTGKTFLVDRASLLRQLEALEHGGDFRQERARRRRLYEDLGRARGAIQAKSVPIAAPREERAHLKDLPGVAFHPGELRIAFADAAQLLMRLLALAETIGRNFSRFEEICEGLPGHDPPN